MNKKLSYFIGALGLYLVVTGVSFMGFSKVNSEGLADISLSGGKTSKITPSPKPKYKVDPSLPRTEECPLDGVKYTKKEEEVWATRRPLAVMIENTEEARPQSGVSRADIVYEALAEGWITRFMGVFYCNTPFENIEFAPVRSARTYFVDFVSEYDALYNHVGGAGLCNDDTVDPRAKALCQIQTYRIKDMDQFGIGYPDCYRNPDRLDHPVATEHTMVCFSENLYKIAQKRDWTNVDDRGIAWDKNFTPWKFTDGAATDQAGVNTVKVQFSQGYEKYDAEWDFDKSSNSYKRKTGGVAHLDLTTKEQITAKNVVIQLAKLTGPVDEHGHMLYGTIGGGKALIFKDGKEIMGTWSKKSRIGRTQYFESDGKEIEFNRGLIWIELIPNESQVTYQ